MADCRRGDDALLCPDCYESGAGAVKLEQTMPRRFAAPVPYIRHSKWVCPACGKSYLAIERVGMSAVRAAARRTERAAAKESETEQGVQSDAAENQDDAQGEPEQGQEA